MVLYDRQSTPDIRIGETLSLMPVEFVPHTDRELSDAGFPPFLAFGDDDDEDDDIEEEDNFDDM